MSGTRNSCQTAWGLMSLFEDWKGRLTLPPLHGLRVKIGRNAVRQLVFRGATTRARIFLNDTPGHDLIKTELKPPYGQLHIRRKGAKRRMMDLPALTANLARDEALPETLTLQWDVVEPLTQRVDTPEKLLATWENQFSFRLEGQSDEPGLRLPQIGASMPSQRTSRWVTSTSQRRSSCQRAPARPKPCLPPKSTCVPHAHSCWCRACPS